MAKDIKRHLSHLKSSGGTAPAAADLVYGEIAVGYKKDAEALYIKNNSGEVITFTSAAGGEAAAEIYTDRRVISTVTGDTEISVSLNAIDETSESGRTLTITHATGSSQSGFKKLSSDSYGHITGGSDVALSDLTGLGALSGVTNGTGISVGTKSSGVQSISLATTGTVGSYAKVVTDSYGRVTSGSATIAESDVTNLTTDLEAKVGTGRTITTASGLTGGGDLSSDLTIGHSNNITAGSAKTSSTSVTATPSGSNIAIPVIEYDVNGHIKSTGSTNVSLKVDTASTGTAGVVKVAETTGTTTGNTVMSQSAVTKAIEDSFTAQDAMRYKGVLTGKTQFESLANYSVGDTYKVASAFTTTSGAKLEVGDMVIAQTSGATFDVGNFNFIQANLDPTAYAVATCQITAGEGLTGGGDLSADRAISHATAFTASAQTTPNTAQTPAFNGTFDIPVIEYDKFGHITGATTTTVKIPNSGNTWSRNYYTSGLTVTTATTSNTIDVKGTNSVVKGTAVISAATTSAAGLMSSNDKTVLDNITPLTGNASTLSAITASSTAINSLTGSVGTMAFQNTSSYSSATQVDTALAGKSDTGHTHSEYVNQNAFSNIKVGSTTVAADTATDTVEFSGDTAISIVGDATNDKVTFSLGDIVCGDYA